MKFTNGSSNNAGKFCVHGDEVVLLDNLTDGPELCLQVVRPHFTDAALLVGHRPGKRASHPTPVHVHVNDGRRRHRGVRQTADDQRVRLAGVGRVAVG